MKVEVTLGQRAFELRLQPENENDRAIVKELGMRVTKPMLITCRGFDYMEPEVEFYVQDAAT